VLHAARCPRCAAPIDLYAAAVTCAECGRAHPRLGQIQVLLPEPDAYLASCRAQLTALERHAAGTLQTIREQAAASDALPVTRARCLSMVAALQGQLADVRGLLDPLLPEDATVSSGGPGARVPSTIEYLHYLYRDWGWPEDPAGENERALATMVSVIEDAPLGRTLVLGAGACRLAYDLHRRYPGTETVVVDLDPLLFTAAHAVVRGGSLVLREANLEIGELAQSSREWLLTARDGALPADRFHFLIADGLEPPFAPDTFDSVLTPWFVDQAPDDVRDFIGAVHRLLRPGGRWLNVGPLLYQPEVPVGLRFGREELFDLAARAGFRVDRWRTDSVPYLVSKLNGRGKVEWVLAFAATRLASGPPRAETGPAAWLIFPHLPVPTFPDQSMAGAAQHGYQLVIDALDGQRTIDGIAREIARKVGDPGVSHREIRAAVRKCLAEIHPESGARA
jgi:SAM-dependent methyltransferase